MKLLFSLLALCTLATAIQYVSGGYNSGGLVSCSGAPSKGGTSGCLFRETFEGSTLCFGGYGSTCDQTQFFVGGSGENFAYATSPAPLQGARSLFLPNSGSPNIEEQVTGQSTLYGAMMISVDSLPASTTGLFNILNSSDVVECELDFFSNNQFNVQSTGGTLQTTTVSLSTNTRYFIAMQATAGSGTNATCTPYFSSNGTSWTTGTASTNGTWTNNVNRMKFQQQPVAQLIIDDVRISTTLPTYW